MWYPTECSLSESLQLCICRFTGLPLCRVVEPMFQFSYSLRSYLQLRPDARLDYSGATSSASLAAFKQDLAVRTYLPILTCAGAVSGPRADGVHAC
jgi:hypothetical protein